MPPTLLQQPGSEYWVHQVTGGWLPQGLLGLNDTLCLSVCPPRCKFFSLTETPEDYTIIVDEEGFLGTCCSPRGLSWAVACGQCWLLGTLFLPPPSPLF